MKLPQGERLKRLNQIAIRQMQVLTSGADPNFFSTSGKSRDFKSSFASGAGVFAFISIYTMIRCGNCIFWTRRNEWGEHPIILLTADERGMSCRNKVKAKLTLTDFPRKIAAWLIKPPPKPLST